MAIIYSYPKVTSPLATDVLVLTDTTLTAGKRKNKTKSLAMSDLAAYVVSSTSAITGSGTTNFVSKWLDSDTIQDSIIFDNGTNVGIGTSSPDYLFEVEKTTSGSATLASFKNTENTGIRISRTGASPGTSVFNVVNNGALYTLSLIHI